MIDPFTVKAGISYVNVVEVATVATWVHHGHLMVTFLTDFQELYHFLA